MGSFFDVEKKGSISRDELKRWMEVICSVKDPNLQAQWLKYVGREHLQIDEWSNTTRMSIREFVEFVMERNEVGKMLRRFDKYSRRAGIEKQATTTATSENTSDNRQAAAPEPSPSDQPTTDASANDSEAAVKAGGEAKLKAAEASGENDQGAASAADGKAPGGETGSSDAQANDAAAGGEDGKESGKEDKKEGGEEKAKGRAAGADVAKSTAILVGAEDAKEIAEELDEEDEATLLPELFDALQKNKEGWIGSALKYVRLYHFCIYYSPKKAPLEQDKMKALQDEYKRSITVSTGPRSPTKRKMANSDVVVIPLHTVMTISKSASGKGITLKVKEASNKQRLFTFEPQKGKREIYSTWSKAIGVHREALKKMSMGSQPSA